MVQATYRDSEDVLTGMQIMRLGKQCFIWTPIWQATKSWPRKDVACGSCGLYETTGVKWVFLLQPHQALPLAIESSLYLQSAFYLLLTTPFSPGIGGQTQQASWFLLLRGWADRGPEPMGLTRVRALQTGRCMCQAGSGREPVSVTKSPNKW